MTASKTKTQDAKDARLLNYERNIQGLKDAGVKFTVNDKKLVLLKNKVGNHVHYWPSTDKWIIRWNLYNNEKRHGLKELIAYIKGE